MHHTIVYVCCCAQVRRRNNIVSDSSLKILAAEPDLYVAEIGGAVTLKLGPRWVCVACHKVRIVLERLAPKGFMNRHIYMHIVWCPTATPTLWGGHTKGTPVARHAVTQLPKRGLCAVHSYHLLLYHYKKQSCWIAHCLSLLVGCKAHDRDRHTIMAGSMPWCWACAGD